MKNPRISITPQAYTAIKIISGKTGKSETSILSELVLANVPQDVKAALDVMGMGDSSKIVQEHRDEKPKEQKVEEPERGASTVSEKKM
jgi:hypothetical protein